MQLRLYKAPRLPKVRLGLCLLSIGCFLVFLIVYILIRFYLPNTPLCLFKLFTGLPCPICGSLRAFEALTRLEVTTALRLNPFVLLAGIIMALVLFLRILTGFKLVLFLKPFEKLLSGLLILILFFGNWVFLILDGR